MIKRLIFTILLNAGALLLVQYILGSDIFSISPTWGFIVVGIVMGVINFIVKPILSLLALPFMLMTFGLFLTVINIFLLYVNQYIFEEILTIGIEFSIAGGMTNYIIASILLSIINSIFHFVIRLK